MRLWQRAMLAAVVFAASCGTRAAVVTATPETAQQVINDARAGDTIRLAAGDYEPIILKKKKWATPVVVEAAAARVKGVAVYQTSGLTWRGGIIYGDSVRPYGFIANNRSDHINVEGVTIRGFTRNGVGFGKVTDVRIIDNHLSDMGSDGINLALSKRGVISGNTCVDFKSTPKAHPDCIQMFSRPNDVMEDITITGNTMIGDMQGIVLFNHVRGGVDDGGADRIVVSGNIVRIKQYHGIFLSSCRDCIVRDNRVENMPDGKSRAWIKLLGDRSMMCGNRVVSSRGGPETKRCD